MKKFNLAVQCVTYLLVVALCLFSGSSVVQAQSPSYAKITSVSINSNNCSIYWLNTLLDSLPSNNGANSFAFTFQVRATFTAVVLLSEGTAPNNTYYNVTLGGWNNEFSTIRKSTFPSVQSSVASPGLLGATRDVSFWVAWHKEGYLSYGVGATIGNGLYATWFDANPLKIRNIGIHGGGSITLFGNLGLFGNQLPLYTTSLPSFRIDSRPFGIHQYKPFGFGLVPGSESKFLMTLVIRGNSDAYIGFVTAFDQFKDMYEISLGALSNNYNKIARSAGGRAMDEVYVGGILGGINNNRTFWIYYDSGYILVGLGNQPGYNMFMQARDPNPLKLVGVSLTSYINPVQFLDIRYLDPNTLPTDTLSITNIRHFVWFSPNYLQSLPSSNNTNFLVRFRITNANVSPNFGIASCYLCNPELQVRFTEAGDDITRIVYKGQIVDFTGTPRLHDPKITSFNNFWIAYINGSIFVGGGEPSEMRIITQFLDNPKNALRLRFFSVSGRWTSSTFKILGFENPNILNFENGMEVFGRRWGRYHYPVGLPSIPPALAKNFLLTFDVRGTKDIYLTLSPSKSFSGPIYEILMAGFGVDYGAIRRSWQGVNEDFSWDDLMTATNFTQVWVLYTNSYLIVGSGEIGSNAFLAYKDPSPLTVSSIGISNWDASVAYRNFRVQNGSFLLNKTQSLFVSASNSKVLWSIRELNLPSNNSFTVAFEGMASRDLYVALGGEKLLGGPIYGLVIGHGGNRFIGLQRNYRGVIVDQGFSPNILSSTTYKSYWISYNNGTVTVGRETPGTFPILRFIDKNPIKVVDIGLGSLTSTPFFRNFRILPYVAPSMYDSSETAMSRFGVYAWSPAIPQIPDSSRFLLQFSVRGRSLAYISLSTAQDNKAPMYEIMLQRFDSAGTGISSIWKYASTQGGWEIDASVTWNIMSAAVNQSRPMWIYYDKGTITVGLNTPGSDIILSTVDTQFVPKFIGLSSYEDPIWFSDIRFTDPNLFFQNDTFTPSSYEAPIRIASGRYDRQIQRPIMPVPEDGTNFLLTFQVLGSNDANFFLYDARGQFYMIVFGGWGGSRCSLRRSGFYSYEMNYHWKGGRPYFNQNTWTSIWVYHRKGTLVVGTGEVNNDGILMVGKDPNPININRLMLTTWSSPVVYRGFKYVTNFMDDIVFPSPPNPTDFILSLTIRGARDALFGLSANTGTYSDMYHMDIGGNGNQLSWVRRYYNGPYLGGLIDPGYMSSVSDRSFWLSLEKGNVTLGKGYYPSSPFLTVKDPYPTLNVKHLGLSSWDVPVVYSNVSFLCRNGTTCSSTLPLLNLSSPAFNNMHYAWIAPDFTPIAFLNNPVSKRLASSFSVRTGCPLTFPESGSFACGFTPFQYKVSDATNSTVTDVVNLFKGDSKSLFLNPTIDNIITIPADMNLEITLLSEDSATRNMLGVFFLDKNGQIDKDSMFDIFPDTSFASNPKKKTTDGRETGDSVTLGPFKKGSRIGFYIYANGAGSSLVNACRSKESQIQSCLRKFNFVNNTDYYSCYRMFGCKLEPEVRVTGGATYFYSVDYLNDDKLRHVGMVEPAGTDDVYVAFEATWGVSNARTFDDLIFRIRPTSPISGIAKVCAKDCNEPVGQCDYTTGECSCKYSIFAKNGTCSCDESIYCYPGCNGRGKCLCGENKCLCQAGYTGKNCECLEDPGTCGNSTWSCTQCACPDGRSNPDALYNFRGGVNVGFGLLGSAATIDVGKVYNSSAGFGSYGWTVDHQKKVRIVDCGNNYTSSHIRLGSTSKWNVKLEPSTTYDVTIVLGGDCVDTENSLDINGALTVYKVDLKPGKTATITAKITTLSSGVFYIAGTSNVDEGATALVSAKILKPACSVLKCPNDCSGNGRCNGASGKCVCDPEFEGTDCNCKIGRDKCINGLFSCETGVCTCLTGYGGVNCMDRTCPQGCVNGRCNPKDGNCICDANYYGPSCEFRKPLGPCVNGNGTYDLYTGACNCLKGWTGTFCDCSTVCPKNCSGSNGVCNCGQCICNSDWIGATDCSCRTRSTLPCVNWLKTWNCATGACNCASGWKGPLCDCSTVCPKSCSGRGVCNCNGTCSCPAQWMGNPVDCSIYTPRSDCVKNNTASNNPTNGACVCKTGWTGDRCQCPTTCPKSCSGRGSCSCGVCKCNTGYTVMPDCSCKNPISGCVNGNGTYDCATGACFCKPGWKGALCDCKTECPGGCTNSNQGTCTCAGTCQCKTGWSGPECKCKTPIGTCLNGNGSYYCDTGKCICPSNFTGDRCECPTKCPNDCSGKGKCVCGKCVCDAAWSEAADCSCHTRLVPGPCPEKHVLNCTTGACDKICTSNICDPKCVNSTGSTGCDCDSKCRCITGWYGTNCECKNCTQPCQNGGTCNCDGTCKCPTGFTSSSFCNCKSCSESCLNNPNTASCSCDGSCVCKPGYVGANCECVAPISGTCVNGTGAYDCATGHCICQPGWKGPLCDCKTTCPAMCSSHGTCKCDGTCDCHPGWNGTDDCSCVTRVGICANAVEGSLKYDCDTGKCNCLPGWKGDLCDCKTECPKNCSSHGTCQCDGTCACDPEWKGASDCSCVTPVREDVIASQWTGKYDCETGIAICKTGFKGPRCECVTTCPGDCSGRGSCQCNGTCLCPEGYQQAADCKCRDPIAGKCANGDGTYNCETGKCNCLPGYKGDLCDCKTVCPNNCTGRGACQCDGTCSCDPEWTGAADCSCKTPRKDCVSGQSTGAFECSTGNCVCNSTNFYGDRCECQKCSVTCKNGGVCNCDGKCTCPAEWRGEGSDCSCRTRVTGSCVNGDGTYSCETGKCNCKPGWIGDLCECPATCNPADCSGNGKCVCGKCVCDADWSEAADCSCHTRLVPGPCPEKHVLNCTTGACDKICTSNICDPICVNSTGSTGCDCDSKCRCITGWYGTNCECKNCTQPCQNGGTCECDGTCKCPDNYFGSLCQNRKCSSACYNSYGTLSCSAPEGNCICKEGYWGDACEKKYCPEPCLNGGVCGDDGICVCPAGYDLPTCKCKTCPASCLASTGSLGCDCQSGACLCKSTHYGTSCQNKYCPEPCQFGQPCSLDGKCLCNGTLAGPACEINLCANPINQTDCGCRLCEVATCLNGGSCGCDGKCRCPAGFSGFDCGCTDCPSNCDPMGTAECKCDGKCTCKDGWVGEFCDAKACKPCYNEGKCLRDGTCQCLADFYGPQCECRKCAESDCGFGLCDCKTGTCQCNAGYTKTSESGPCNCSTAVCPSNCSSHGTCNCGSCACSSGWSGADCSCSTAACPSNCNGRGTCTCGQCYCASGFYGESCSLVECPRYNGLVCGGSERGVCDSSTGTCTCLYDYFSGNACQTYTAPCPKDLCGVCNGNNSCVGCDGIPNSGLIYDACGACGGDNSSCPVGCDGIPYSGLVLDVCGVCGGNGTGCDLDLLCSRRTEGCESCLRPTGNDAGGECRWCSGSSSDNSLSGGNSNGTISDGACFSSSKAAAFCPATQLVITCPVQNQTINDSGLNSNDNVQANTTGTIAGSLGAIVVAGALAGGIYYAGANRRKAIYRDVFGTTDPNAINANPLYQGTSNAFENPLYRKPQAKSAKEAEDEGY